MDWTTPPKVNPDSAVRGFLYFMAIWITGTGILALYAGLLGADIFYFLDIGAYIWIGVVQFGMGLLIILTLYLRPHWFEVSAQ